MPDTVRVLIVDDSAFVRRAVERMLAAIPSVRVVGTASNGEEAVERTRELRPDVVVLDVNMPILDGLGALERIMAETPTSVLMLSTLTREGADITMTALDLGAVDFLDKTSAGTAMDIYSLAPVLREKVLAVADAALPAASAAEPKEEVTLPLAEEIAARPSRFEVVVIGTSTGGPRALTEVVGRLPANFPAGIVIAQHMPPGFTATLAERLDRRSHCEVLEGTDGMEIIPGRAIVAPGGKQITLARHGPKLVIRVDPGPSNLLHRPSVDLLFHSAADVVGARAIGVVLTGMGDDGARGLQAMQEAGAATIAESERSAVIYGMPKAAAGAADQILPLHEIGPALVTLVAKQAQGEGVR